MGRRTTCVWYKLGEDGAPRGQRREWRLLCRREVKECTHSVYAEAVVLVALPLEPKFRSPLREGEIVPNDWVVMRDEYRSSKSCISKGDLLGLIS